MSTVNPLIQLRGNCQCCGRLQAVTRGFVAKHGYTVKQGWFNGVCQGSGEEPMQTSIAITTKIVARIRQDCADLGAKVIRLIAGDEFPPPIKSCMPGAKPTPYVEATAWDQRSALESAIFTAKHRAEMGRRIASELEALAASRIGTELVKALRDTAPPPICLDEVRYDENGRALKSTNIAGARVYWKTLGDNPIKGWTGSAAWRRHSTTAP